MNTAIGVVWSIGLVGALAATLLILKESFLLIRTLYDILQLAQHAAISSRGIAAHTEAVSSLSHVGEVLRPVDAALGDVATALEQVATRLQAVTR